MGYGAAATAQRSARSDWGVPAALLTLSFVPSVAGAFRLAELANGAAITPENARFFVEPFPVVLHIPSVVVYCVLGAFQFAAEFRRRRPAWHRAAGRLLIVFGLISALTGLWMTWVYPYAPGDGFLLYAIRQVVGWAMFLSIVLGLVAIRRRNFAKHRAWMIRGYAIGQGAGTQVVTGLVWALLFGNQEGTTRALVLGASWLINISVGEWVIRRRPGGGLQQAERSAI
jgi:Predicted membrane protein (DUF2306)